MTNPCPAVSVVINTCDRPALLRRTIESLETLNYAPFEVVVVDGSQNEDTASVLASFAGRIRSRRCHVRNLSMSRNIGIAAAAGAIVAFIDDDAIPEPDWLSVLTGALSDPEVAAAGGPVFDHTGLALQARYNVADSLGGARHETDAFNPTTLFASPDSDLFVYPTGTNSAFRRDCLLQIGGFDEEFDYYLDETDVCRRLVDEGYIIAAADRGYVHHKFAASAIRSPGRALRDRYSVLKNRVYFALRHGRRHHSFDAIIAELQEYTRWHIDDCQMHVTAGGLTSVDLDALHHAIPRAFNDGLAAFMRGPLLRDPTWFMQHPTREDFIPFPTRRPPGGRLSIVYVVQEWPPQRLNGVSRVVHTTAQQLADMGHTITILAPAEAASTVDYESGTWVHRIVAGPERVGDAAPMIPPRIARRAQAYRDELERLSTFRAIDIVQIPNWDSEGIEIMRRGTYRTILSLHTTVREFIATDRDGASDPSLESLAELERICYQSATAYLASSDAILRDVEASYSVKLPTERTGIVPHGLPDLPRPTDPARTRSAINLLFVGRLEPRKGLDVLLEAAPSILDACPNAVLRIVGSESHAHSVPTPKTRWEWSSETEPYRDRVVFVGAVNDDNLAYHYAAADIVIVPSRYESFGLVLLEAMRFAIPVVASAVGGMLGIVRDAQCGITIPPDDPLALSRAVVELVHDEPRRRRMGSHGRQAFADRYTASRMADEVVAFYRDVISRLDPAPGLVLERPEERTPPEQVDILRLLQCPVCSGELTAHDTVRTVTGACREGRLLCATCGVIAAEVERGRYDFHARGPVIHISDELVVLPELGERRVAPGAPTLNIVGEWAPHDSFLLSERAGDTIECESVCSDAYVRLLRHPWSGQVEVLLDGEVVGVVDLFEEEGSMIIPIPIVHGAAPRRRRVGVRASGHSHPDALGAQVLFQEFVFDGPHDPASGFVRQRADNRGNPYSPAIERYLSTARSDALILECGGGDRRRCRPRHINFEYLAFEFADVLGDVHHLPFRDDAFDFVVSQAVFEHLRNPFQAAAELRRVARPGGIIITEVAFMQPLHAVPSHYFNMTPWGVAELFEGCDVLESNWFGSLSETVDWLIRSANLPEKVPPERIADAVALFREFDASMTHEDLRSVASGVYHVVRKPDVAATQPARPSVARSTLA